MKPIIWLGNSLETIQKFEPSARTAAGHNLRRVQSGLLPHDWRPMASVGPGAIEIRIHEQVEHRVIYVAKFETAVYVLHAFVKKTQRTPSHDLELAVTRYRLMADRERTQR
ncbi:MAG: type II toxin-antitoxin system RelE/ParE family toxin [Gammaproteobacteria bacterium]|nr:type II toxin-antitoxin system RelE/ParE family toxin [Gammaproteobacteria bacterium]